MLMEICLRRMFVNCQLSWVVKFSLRIVDFLMLSKTWFRWSRQIFHISEVLVFIICRSSDFSMLSTLDLYEQYRCSMFAQSWFFVISNKMIYWYCHQLSTNLKCWLLTFTNFQNLWFWEYHIYRCYQNSK